MLEVTPTNRRGRVAVVTGASRGLGRALASFLAGRGYTLIIDARDRQELDLAAEGLRLSGTDLIALAGDVTDPSHQAELVEAATALGGVDLLVNNAAVLGPSPLPRLDEVSLDAVRSVLEVNVLAPLALTQALLELLEARRGLVVNLTSDAAGGGYEGWGVYGASKAALDLLTLTMAAELAPRGVAAVGVDPGDMRTRMHQLAFPNDDISDRPVPEVTMPFWAWLLARHPQEVNGRRFAAQGDVWPLEERSSEDGLVVV